MSYKPAFLAKFISISIFKLRYSIICDCNIISDFRFLIEPSNITASNDSGRIHGYLENFVCYRNTSTYNLTGSVSQLYYLFQVVDLNDTMQRSEF